MAGFIIFSPARFPSPDQCKVIEKGYSFKVSDLLVPKGITHNYRFFESILPSHRYRGVPEGEHLLDDILICPECVLSVSLMCALNG